MRTDRYRLVAWKDTGRPQAAPLFVEIYDHQRDPLETVNIADKNPALQAQLMAQFAAGWKGNGPKSATANAAEPNTSLFVKLPNPHIVHHH